MVFRATDQKERIRKKTIIDESTGCWLWQGSLDQSGYGRLRVSLGRRDLMRYTSAHRYSWEIFVGPIPPGMCVLHKCDVRRCCNHEHLFIGTHLDNMRDMIAKGRGPNRKKSTAPAAGTSGKEGAGE